VLLHSLDDILCIISCNQEELKAKDVAEGNHDSNHNEEEFDIELHKAAASLPVEALLRIGESEIIADVNLATESAIYRDDSLFLRGEEGSFLADECNIYWEHDGESDDGGADEGWKDGDGCDDPGADILGSEASGSIG